LRGMTKSSSFLHFTAIFVSYCPLFWGSGLIYKVHDTQYIFEGHEKKFIIFAFYSHFRELLPIVWGSMEIYKEYDSMYILERNDKKLVVLHFRLFLWAIAHSFGVPGWFTRPMTLSTFLRGMTNNSSFLHFRGIFMSYCP
jgi:hypothetical protein